MGPDVRAPSDLVEIFEVELDLSAEGFLGEYEGVCAYAVRYFNGTAATCFLQFDRHGGEGRRVELEGISGASWRTPRKVYIHNNIAQSGKTLKVKFGREGAFVTAGVSGGGATAAKQDLLKSELEEINAALDSQGALISGQKTCPSGAGNQEAIGSTQVVPDNCAVVVTADADNGEYVLIGSATTCTAAAGYKLEPGCSVALKVDDVALIYCLGQSASKGLSWIVEIAA